MKEGGDGAMAMEDHIHSTCKTELGDALKRKAQVFPKIDPKVKVSGQVIRWDLIPGSTMRAKRFKVPSPQ